MPHARTTDPTTSHEAAASVKHLSRTQSGILGILRTPNDRRATSRLVPDDGKERTNAIPYGLRVWY